MTASLTTDEFAAELSVSAGAQPGAESQNTWRTHAKIFYLLQKIFMIGDASTESQNTKDHVDVMCVVCR